MTNTFGEAQEVWQLSRAFMFSSQDLSRYEKSFDNFEIIFDKNSQSIEFSCMAKCFYFYF